MLVIAHQESGYVKYRYDVYVLLIIIIIIVRLLPYTELYIMDHRPTSIYANHG